MSIEPTTSANKAVTCLYSADRGLRVSGVAHLLQNFAVAAAPLPHDRQEAWLRRLH